MDILNAFPGWTWEYVEENITVPRVNALVKYWGEKCPPASKSLACWIGFKPKTTEPAPATGAELSKQNEDALLEIMSMFPSAPPKPLPFIKPSVKQNG